VRRRAAGQYATGQCATGGHYARTHRRATDHYAPRQPAWPNRDAPPICHHACRPYAGTHQDRQVQRALRHGGHRYRDAPASGLHFA